MFHEYEYTHTETVATTGYFSCLLKEPFDLDQIIEDLEKSPYETFLHRFLLSLLSRKDLSFLQKLCTKAYDGKKNIIHLPALTSVLLELASLNPHLNALCPLLPRNLSQEICNASPLPYLRCKIDPDREIVSSLSLSLAPHLLQHTALSDETLSRICTLYSEEELCALYERLSRESPIQRLHKEASKEKGNVSPDPQFARYLYREVCDSLLEQGCLIGQEMRHEASLAPFALLREWNLFSEIDDHRNSLCLRGKATAYGRGLSLDQARLSCIMEVLERFSCYASVGKKGAEGEISDRRHPLSLRRERISELKKQNVRFLDPNSLPLETRTPDEKISWIEARNPKNEIVLVPAQSVFLFMNLDEPELMLAQGSTGLAAGSTLEQAKVHAITEILERDSEATVPFARERCFTVKSRDPRLQALLDEYEARSIHVQFLDITSEFGVPAYKAFVQTHDGQIIRACASKLSAYHAALSALTETPYGFSLYERKPGEGTVTPESDTTSLYLEDLPNYSLPSQGAELALLEGVLGSFGYEPLYIDISRNDMPFYVVRVIIAGLEQTAELDAFSRPSRRLCARLLHAQKKV